MPAPDNQILLRLQPATRAQLLQSCVLHPLVPQAWLAPPEGPLEGHRHVDFPRSGIVTLTIHLAGHAPLAIGMVGREGVLGSECWLGNGQPPWRAQVQGAGSSWRIEAHALMALGDSFPDLREVLMSDLLLRMHQRSLASGCQRFHEVRPRLARWLLMTDDRALNGRFHATQEVLATLLGVRRESVTTAASELQREGSISYRRGEVHVLDRTGLRASACSCYAAERQMARGFAPQA